MKSVAVAVAVFLALASQTMCKQLCQPPKYETVFYRTKLMIDHHVYYDFDQGKIFYVYSDDPNSIWWSMVDLNARLTYTNSPSGCRYISHPANIDKVDYEVFERCLPDDAQLIRSGDVDFYYIKRDYSGLEWLIGIRDVPNTDFFYVHFSRFSSAGTGGVGAINEDDTYGIAYKTSVGISDPTVFDKDLSACVEGPPV